MILYQRTNVEYNGGGMFKFLLLKDKNDNAMKIIYEIYGTEIYQE